MGEVESMIADTSGPLTHGRARQQRPVVAPLAVARLQYRAVWRSKQLLIFPIDCHPFRQSVSAVLEGDRHRLLVCLKHSPVRRLLLSTELSVAELLFWANLGREAGLPIYMRRLKGQRPRRQMRLTARLISIASAACLLILASPIMLGVGSLLLLFSGKMFKRNWEIGTDGQFFQAFQFSLDDEQLPDWLVKNQQLEIMRWPILLNVVRGNVGLFQAQSLSGFSSCLEQKSTEAAFDVESARL